MRVKILSYLFLIILVSTSVQAFGIAYEYMEDNSLFLYPGQSYMFKLEVQNTKDEEETVNIKAKGDREYTVNIDTDALEAIKAYLNVREEPKEGHIIDEYSRKLYHRDAVFLNGYGKRLCGVTINNIMKRYAIEMELEKPLYPHLMRATACTIMDERGMTLPQIKEQSGHSNIQSLRTYIRPNKKVIKEKVKASLSLYETQPEPPKPEPKRKPDIPVNLNGTDKTEKYVALLKKGLITTDDFIKLVSTDKKPDTPNYFQ